MLTMPSPDRILQVALAFSQAKTVLTAVELGVFGALAKEPLTLKELCSKLDLHERAASDFFDALVALEMLQRDASGRYSNAKDCNQFLDPAKPTYIGGMFELASTRIFPLWCGLADLLKTGKPQNEEKDGVGLWQYLAKDLAQLKRFMSAMTGVTLGDAILIAAKFPWHKYKTFVDVGAAQGALPVRVALAHPHLTGGSYDLPFVREIFEEYVAQFGLSDRLHFYPGDMKAGPLPTADVLSFGHLLHGEGVPERKALMTKAFAAINAGGALIVYDAMIDDERTKVMGFMSSLNIMLETWLGFESTVGQSAAWLREAGFVDIQVEPLFGPTTMVWGTKP